MKIRTCPSLVDPRAGDQWIILHVIPVGNRQRSLRCGKRPFCRTDQGNLSVEALSGDGRPIPGFELQNCIPIKAGGLNVGVTWKQPSQWQQLSGKAVSLRIQMRNTDLYSFRARP